MDVTAESLEMATKPPLEAAVAKVEFRPRAYVVERKGSWIKAAALIMTTTTLPTLLALPSALAGLGWAGGILILMFSSLGALYCLWKVVALNFVDGKAHKTFPDLAVTIMGRPWWGTLVRSLQFSVQWGASVANIIMVAQLCNNAFQNACGSNCDVMGQSRFAAVAGAALILVGQLPDISNRNDIIIFSGATTLFYCVAAIILSSINNVADSVSHSPAGSPPDKFFTALNSIGIIYFVFGDTCYPELQTMLKEDLTGSTIPPMHRGMTLAFSLTVPLLTAVACVGFWAFGTSVTSILITWDMEPHWLALAAGVTMILQLIFSCQIFAQPIYNWVEIKIMRAFPGAKWMQHTAQVTDEKAVVIVPSWPYTFIVRTVYALTITVVAVFFPAFDAVMGFIGAAGLTPLTYIIPLTLYIVVHKSSMSKFSLALNVGLAVAFAAAGLLAVCGAVRSMVISFENFSLSN